MLSSTHIILLLSSIASPCFAQNFSDTVCDKNVITATLNATLAKEGPVCGLSLGTHLDFTQCCAPNQPIYTTNACTQYCQVDKNQTAGFTDCARLVARDQNLTLGITACEGGAGRIGQMSSAGAVIGAAFIGLVLAF